MLNKRRKTILHFLIGSHAAVHIKDLQQLFSVSERTIRYDLQYIQELLMEYKIYFKQSAQKGTWKIDFSTVDSTMLQKLSDSLLFQSHNSQEERMLFILELILNTPTWITLRELADKLDVSRATVLNNIENTKKWLELFSLELHRGGKGFACTGTERNRILAYISLIISFEYHLEVTNPLPLLNFKYMTYKEVKWVYNNCKVNFSPHLYMMIALFIERKRAGLILTENIPIQGEVNTDLYGKIDEVLLKVEENMATSFSEIEKTFMYQYVLATTDGLAVDEQEMIQDKRFLTFVKALETRLGINLEQNNNITFLYKAWKRIFIQHKYEIAVYHSTVETIKERYPLLLQHAVEIVKENKDLSFISEHHLVPIVIWLAIMYEETFSVKNKYRVWVVCQKGIATSQLLAITIRNHFPNIEILHILSKDQLMDYHGLEKPDFIISTMSLATPPYPYIKVKPIMTKTELKRMKQFLTIIEQKNKQVFSSEKKFTELIPLKRRMVINDQVSSFKKLVRLGVDLLIDDYFVTEQYFHDLWKSVSKDAYFFELVPGIMFLHTKSDSVIKPGFSFIQLKHPFIIKSKSIHSHALIFMATPNETAHISQLEVLHEVLLDEKQVNMLKYGDLSSGGELDEDL